MQVDLLRNFLVIRGKGLRYIFRFSFIILCKILIYLCYSIACFSINSSVNIVLSGSNRSSITGSTQILYIFIFSAKTIITFYPVLAECLLLCRLLCKCRLLPLHKHHCTHDFPSVSGFPAYQFRKMLKLLR